MGGALGKLGNAIIGPGPQLLAGKSLGDVARSGGLGLIGLAAAKKKKPDDDEKPPSAAAAPPGARKGGKLKKMCSGGKSYAKGGDVANLRRQAKQDDESAQTTVNQMTINRGEDIGGQPGSARKGFKYESPGAQKNFEDYSKSTANYKRENAAKLRRAANKAEGPGPTRYAKGGAIDGIARRGKTRCKKC